MSGFSQRGSGAGHNEDVPASKKLIFTMYVGATVDTPRAAILRNDFVNAPTFVRNGLGTYEMTLTGIGGVDSGGDQRKVAVNITGGYWNGGRVYEYDLLPNLLRITITDVVTGVPVNLDSTDSVPTTVEVETFENILQVIN